MASKSSVAISEILGIAPIPHIVPPSISANEAASDQVALATSTKTVTDYFRDKLALKPAAGSRTAKPNSSPTHPPDDYDTPYKGLGVSRLQLKDVTSVSATSHGNRSSLPSTFSKCALECDEDDITEEKPSEARRQKKDKRKARREIWH